MDRIVFDGSSHVEASLLKAEAKSSRSCEEVYTDGFLAIDSHFREPAAPFSYWKILRRFYGEEHFEATSLSDLDLGL